MASRSSVTGKKVKDGYKIERNIITGNLAFLYATLVVGENTLLLISSDK